MNLQLSHSKMADTKTQSALVEFRLADKETKSTEQVLVEFTKDELMDFYRKVCRIFEDVFSLYCTSIGTVD